MEISQFVKQEMKRETKCETKYETKHAIAQPSNKFRESQNDFKPVSIILK